MQYLYKIFLGGEEVVPLPLSSAVRRGAIGGEAGVGDAAHHGLVEGGGLPDHHGAVVLHGTAGVADQAAVVALAQPGHDLVGRGIAAGAVFEGEAAADLVAGAGDVAEGHRVLQRVRQYGVQEGHLGAAVVVAAHPGFLPGGLQRVHTVFDVVGNHQPGLGGVQLCLQHLGLGLGVGDGLADRLFHELVVEQGQQDQRQHRDEYLLGAGEITAHYFHRCSPPLRQTV